MMAKTPQIHTALFISITMPILILGNFNLASGKELDLNSPTSLDLNPINILNSAGINDLGIGGAVLSDFQLKFPFDFDLKNINIDTNIPISPKANESQGLLEDINLKQFLTPRDISSDDFITAVKALVTFVIEIFLVVISITSQILKVVLGFLK